MRIAYVCADPGVPVFGRKGCSVHVQEMLRAFLKRGTQIDLFAAARGEKCPADLGEVRVHDVRGFKHPADPADVAPLQRANAELIRLLEDNRPFDLVYERYSLWSHAGMRFAREACVPGVLEVNAPLIEEQARYRRLTAPDFAQRIAEQAFEGADVICAVSSQVANYLEYFPAANGRVHVVPNGVDPARFEQRDDSLQPGDFGDDSRTFTVGFVGSLKPWHGVSALVEAFAALHRAHPETRLLIVGDGPERENILTQLSDAGDDVLAASCLTGAIPSQDVPRYLSQMDVGVAPYPAMPDFYFSPMKIFEYMAAGLPVVCSRVGDLTTLLRGGSDVIFYAPDDAVQLAEVLARLREDLPLRRRLGEAARETVLQHHTWEGVAERVLSLAGVADASLMDIYHDTRNPA